MIPLHFDQINVKDITILINSDRKKKKKKKIKTIYDLQFFHLCEVKTVLELKRQGVIKRRNTSMVSIFNGIGPDIIIYGKKSHNKIRIEIKGSTKKNDYLNESIYKNKNVFLYGNSLKWKDFDVSGTGNIVADYVIVVCCYDSNVKKTKLSKFGFYIFDREKISQLTPKSSIFIPGFVLNRMVSLNYSYITDRYTDLKEGVMQLFCEIDNLETSLRHKDIINDFRNVWNRIQCPLLYREANNIVNKVILDSRNLKNNWRLVTYNTRNITGPIKASTIFKNNPCRYYDSYPILELPCVLCRTTIQNSIQAP